MLFEITKENYEELATSVATKTNLSKFFGQIKVGELCFDILLSDYGIPVLDCYVLGLDQGYGETSLGSIPYAMVDSAEAPSDFSDFSAWKTACEATIRDFIDSHPERDFLREKAAAPLGCWD